MYMYMMTMTVAQRVDYVYVTTSRVVQNGTFFSNDTVLFEMPSKSVILRKLSNSE